MGIVLLIIRYDIIIIMQIKTSVGYIGTYSHSDWIGNWYIKSVSHIPTSRRHTYALGSVAYATWRLNHHTRIQLTFCNYCKLF